MYRVIIIDGTTVYVQGGRYFPDPTRARVNGSTIGGSLLKVAWIDSQITERRLVKHDVHLPLRSYFSDGQFIGGHPVRFAWNIRVPGVIT